MIFAVLGDGRYSPTVRLFKEHVAAAEGEWLRSARRHKRNVNGELRKKNYDDAIWVFPKIGVPQNGWFIMEHPIKMDDLGVHLFLEASICSYFVESLLPDSEAQDFCDPLQQAPI